MKSRFELVDGKIYLIVTQLVWGETIEVLRQDVTESSASIVNEYLKQQELVTN